MLISIQLRSFRCWCQVCFEECPRYSMDVPLTLLKNGQVCGVFQLFGDKSRGFTSGVQVQDKKQQHSKLRCHWMLFNCFSQFMWKSTAFSLLRLWFILNLVDERFNWDPTESKMNLIFDKLSIQWTVLLFGTTWSRCMGWKLEVLAHDIHVLLQKKSGQKISICPSQRFWELLRDWFGKNVHSLKSTKVTAKTIVGQSLYFSKMLLRVRKIARIRRARNDFKMSLRGYDNN